MTHRIAFLVPAAIACLASLTWIAWLLVTGPMAPVIHSGAEAIFGVFTIVLICVSIIAATLVGSWNLVPKGPELHPRPHHFGHHRPLHH